MNRRDFIKSTAVAATIPAISLTCKYEDDEKGPEKEAGWNYEFIVTSEVRKWTFSKDTTGSFCYLREYEIGEETHSVYSGWMDHGKLHFEAWKRLKTSLIRTLNLKMMLML